MWESSVRVFMRVFRKKFLAEKTSTKLRYHNLDTWKGCGHAPKLGQCWLTDKNWFSRLYMYNIYDGREHLKYENSDIAYQTTVT